MNPARQTRPTRRIFSCRDKFAIVVLSRRKRRRVPMIENKVSMPALLARSSPAASGRFEITTASSAFNCLSAIASMIACRLLPRPEMSTPILRPRGSDPIFSLFVIGTEIAVTERDLERPNATNARVTTANYVYHVLNRSAKQGLLFIEAADYLAFENLLGEANERVRIRILAYCLMPNHWHLLLWPYERRRSQPVHEVAGDNTRRRWNRAHEKVGNGAVYQSRFKSIPVEHGPHLFRAWRYIERNALTGKPGERAEDWRWSSLNRRTTGKKPEWLAAGPMRLPSDWTDMVNVPQTEMELDVTSAEHGSWKAAGQRRVAYRRHRLSRGRPNLRKAKK